MAYRKTPVRRVYPFHVLVPIKEPDTARRGSQAFLGVGASFLFGK